MISFLPVTIWLTEVVKVAHSSLNPSTQVVCSGLRTALATGLALAMSIDVLLEKALIGEFLLLAPLNARRSLTLSRKSAL